jgi:hypothetical protein
MTVGRFIGGHWVSEFRVVEIAGMYSPQQGYLVMDQERWFSLLRDGSWADPGSWNVRPDDGEGVVVLMETREMADAAIAKARAICGYPLVAKFP